MLSTFACRQKIVPPHSFWRMCWSQSRRENHQKVSCASKSVLALLVLAGDIELNPGPLRNASSLPPLTGCLTLPSRECRIKGFSIIHLNARSLYSHLNGLVAFILPRVPDVVAVGGWMSPFLLSILLIQDTSCSGRTGIDMVGEVVCMYRNLLSPRFAAVPVTLLA